MYLWKYCFQLRKHVFLYIKQQQSTVRTDTSSYRVNIIIYSCLLSQQNTVYNCLLSQHQCSVTNPKACRHFFCANHQGTINKVIIISPSKLTFKQLFSHARCTWQWILFHVGNTFCLPQHLMQMHGQTKNFFLKMLLHHRSISSDTILRACFIVSLGFLCLRMNCNRQKILHVAKRMWTCWLW